jgi:WD40 repeat protein
MASLAIALTPSAASAAGVAPRYRVVSTTSIPMAPIGEIAVSKDGRLLAVAGLWGTVDIWDWRRGMIVQSRQIRQGYIENLFFMDDDRRLSVLYAEDIQQHLYVWELATGAVADEEMVDSLGRPYPAPDGTIGLEHGNGMAFMDQKGAYANRHVVLPGMSIGYALSPDGTFFAGPGTGYIGGVRYYDHLVISDSEGKVIKLIDVGFDARETVISPDSRTVAVRQREDRGKSTPASFKTAVNGFDLYDVESSKKLRRIGGHSQFVSGGLFSPDSARFLTWSSDKTLALWDVATGKLVHRFEGHRDSVSAGLFLDGGALIASSSMDGSVKIWSAADGRELASLHTLGNQTDEPSFIALQPDGRLFEKGPKQLKIIEVKADGKDGPALPDDKRAALRVPVLEVTAPSPPATTPPAKR